MENKYSEEDIRLFFTLLEGYMHYRTNYYEMFCKYSYFIFMRDFDNFLKLIIQDMVSGTRLAKKYCIKAYLNFMFNIPLEDMPLYISNTLVDEDLKKIPLMWQGSKACDTEIVSSAEHEHLWIASRDLFNLIAKWRLEIGK